MAKVLTQEEFINKCLTRHNGLYSYPNLVYVNNRTKVEIVCKTHGVFWQKAESHSSGRGCPDCWKIHNSTAGDIGRNVRKKIAKDKFYLFVQNNELEVITEYEASKIPVFVRCILCSTITAKTPDSMMRKALPRCKKCIEISLRDNYIELPTTLYYFEYFGVWKIGITTKSLQKRYPLDYQNFTNIVTWKFDTGLEALNYEQEIKRMYSKYRYTGVSPFKDGTGTTECFNKDIFKFEEAFHE